MVARCEAVVQQRFGADTSAARSQPYYQDLILPRAVAAR